MQPVYEQIVCQIKGKIIQGELIEETLLPVSYTHLTLPTKLEV